MALIVMFFTSVPAPSPASVMVPLAKVENIIRRVGCLSPALRAEHVILFRKALEEGRLTGTPLAKATVNRKLAVVKSFLSWLKINHVIADNPAQWVKGFPQTQESGLKGFSDEEARKILLLPRLNSKAGALHAAVLHMLLINRTLIGISSYLSDTLHNSFTMCG